MAAWAAVTLWWLANPYSGIRHDALFYAADALRRLHPASLGHDLFFHRLSQGDFSWFGTAYAAAIRLAGLDAAGWAITLTARAAWCLALWAWCRAVSAGRWASAWLAITLCLPTTYGAAGALAAGEPFATPRLVAEALVLAGLALAWRGKTVLAWLAMALALATHPLMALGGAALLLWMLPQRVRLTVAATCTLAIGGLASAGVEPFSRLVQFYDPAWWAIVERQNPMTVFSRWTMSDASHVAVALLMLADAARRSGRGSPARQMACGLAVVVMTSLVAWAWATATHHVLLIQLQVWRAFWLLQVLTPAIWLASLSSSPRPALGVQAATLLLVAWCMDAVAAPALALLGLALAERPAKDWHPALERAMPALVATLSLLFVASRFEPLIHDPGLHVATLGPEQAVARVVREPVIRLLIVGTLAAASAMCIARRSLTPPTVWAARLSALTLATLLIGWSWRLQAPAETTPVALAAVANRAIRPDATVWSDAGVHWSWLRLRRSHWVSQEQRAGVLFSREAAMTWQARWQVLEGLGLTGEAGQQPMTPALQVRTLCAQPDLDVVLLQGVRADADRVLSAPQTRAQLSLFDCQRRRGAT